MSVKQQFTEEEIYKDRDSQISAIEKTFEDAQKTVSELVRMPTKALPLAIYVFQLFQLFDLIECFFFVFLFVVNDY